MKFSLKNRKGFTLIELLVVIVIIGILATLATVGLNSVRAKARDSKRISDIRQMQSALELYFNDNNGYPTNGGFVIGSPLTSPDGTRTYMSKIPSNPKPWAEGACVGLGAEYTYNYINANSYQLGYCLANKVNDLPAGMAQAMPGNINNACTPSCSGKCGQGDGCGGTCPACSYVVQLSASTVPANADVILRKSAANDLYLAYINPNKSNNVDVLKFNRSNGAWESMSAASGILSVGGKWDMDIDPSNVPYVVAATGASSVTVMKWTSGTTWSQVGGVLLDGATSGNPTISFDSSGNAYVAHTDGAYSHKIIIKKYSGSWVLVGSSGTPLSTSAGDYDDIIFDSAGTTPYVSYRDQNDMSVYVKKLVGTTWSNVDTGIISPASSYRSRLAKDSSGNIWAGYINSSNFYVRKYNGSSWQAATTAATSVSGSAFSDLVFDPSNQLYFCYSDGTNILVNKFDGTSTWSAIDSGVGTGQGAAIIFDTDGGLIVAYVNTGTNTLKVVKRQ